MLFKLDKTGEGQEICIEDLGMNRGMSFVGFSPQMFLEVSPEAIWILDPVVKIKLDPLHYKAMSRQPLSLQLTFAASNV